MSSNQRTGLRRIARHRRRGQSIPIIALMIVILVAMVGLSVDVGNTFSHERQAVSAGNAASIAGMTAYIQRTTGTTDKNIYDAIANSLRSNGIKLGDGSNDTVAMTAYYLNSKGEEMKDHPVVLADGSAVPSGVGFIQVKLEGDVNTSFARMVGRADLPISASAHAGLCPINSGVYPIAIDSTTITDNQFNDSKIDKSDPAQYQIEYHMYKGYYQRRIYVKDDSTAGSFSYLRWMEDKGANGKSATSAFELAASLSGDGNIAAGFEEAPWPSSKPLPSGGYTPDGILNDGDWVWGSPGWKENNGGGKDGASVSAAIQNHIDNQTRLMLPIYNEIRGNGDNVQMHIQRLGVFIIVDRGKEPTKGPYFDMIYMGEPTKQYTACSVTPPPPASTNLELAGDVSFYPEYQVSPESQRPIQYVVVLDGSGSMSANFNGQCNNTGKTLQCANGPAGFPQLEVTNTGVDYWWTKTTERRIYVAKKALERLVRLANMPGNDGYTTSRPPDQMAVVWFREYVPSSQTKGFSKDPNSIVNYITNLNTTKGDTYRSEGGTNGAAGLYRASLLYDDAPKTVPFNGKDVEYKRVVLFITDGVSNQFLDIDAEDLWGGQSTSGTYPKKSFCRGLAEKVIESAECQTTEGADGSMYKGWERPITQMINTSEEYLRNTKINASVFVIALSNLPSTGLSDGIPSSSNYFFSAEGLEIYPGGKTNVDGIIDIINAQVEAGTCAPGPSGSPTDIISSNQFVNGTNGLTYPTVGKVKISNATDTLYADIKAGTDGSLSYFFPSVPQGTYRLEAYLFYRHPLDPPGVLPRMYSKIWTSGQSQTDYTVKVSPSTQGSGFTQRINQPLTLKLNGDICPTL